MFPENPQTVLAVTGVQWLSELGQWLAVGLAGAALGALTVRSVLPRIWRPGIGKRLGVAAGACAVAATFLGLKYALDRSADWAGIAATVLAGVLIVLGAPTVGWILRTVFGARPETSPMIRAAISTPLAMLWGILVLALGAQGALGTAWATAIVATIGGGLFFGIRLAREPRSS